MNENNLIREGDLVLIWFDEKVSYLVKMVKETRLGIHCGKPIELEELIGREFGEKLVCQHAVAYLLKPTTEDLMMKASRQSGIIYPKDAGKIMIRAGIHSGTKVLEVGTGSGSLTTALAHFVKPEGKVVTYDKREDLPKNAIKNVKRSGLEALVEFKQREAMTPFDEAYFDVAILDIPNPWDEVEYVKEVLKGGGRLVSLNPTYNQIEKMAETLRSHGFVMIESLELLERPILARAGKTRPVQRMVSHTEFMVFATRVL